jgi:hypothetical protein
MGKPNTAFSHTSQADQVDKSVNKAPKSFLFLSASMMFGLFFIAARLSLNRSFHTSYDLKHLTIAKPFQ